MNGRAFCHAVVPPKLELGRYVHMRLSLLQHDVPIYFASAVTRPSHFLLSGIDIPLFVPTVESSANAHCLIRLHRNR